MIQRSTGTLAPLIFQMRTALIFSLAKYRFAQAPKLLREKRDKNHTAALALSHNLISFFKFLSSFRLSNGSRQSVPERVPEGLPGMVQLG